MGQLNDIIAEDSAIFVDIDGFGETVTYNPLNGASVSIPAIVERDPPVTSPSPSMSKAPRMYISIRNKATVGRTSIDTGGDTITVAYRYGGTAEAHPVRRILKQDAGMWVLEVD